jgi:hypothetical protein
MGLCLFLRKAMDDHARPVVMAATKVSQIPIASIVSYHMPASLHANTAHERYVCSFNVTCAGCRGPSL